MTLTKNKMIREIGRRTRLKNREVQLMLEKLIDVWTQELVSGGRIELENFMVLEVKTIDRGVNSGMLYQADQRQSAPRIIKRVIIKSSQHLKSRLLK